MLGSPEFSTLPRLIWQQLRFAGSPTSLAAAMILAALTAALACIAVAAQQRASRMEAASRSDASPESR
jgi:ABC-type spermidine/putrescine transport system permease subunit II